MKRLTIITAFFLAVQFSSVYSQEQATAAGLISDANSYRNTISNKHKNPFTKISKSEFDQRIDSLIANIPSLDRNRFIVGLMEINSLITDEHSNLFPEFGNTFPLRFDYFDEGMAIIAADSIHQGLLLHRIIAIENTTWVAVDSLFKTIIKQDNPAFFRFFEGYYLRYPELLYGLGIAGNSGNIEFTLLSPEGKTVTAVVGTRNGTGGNSLSLAPQFKNLLAYAQNRNYWYQYDYESKTLYFNYQKCEEDTSEPFKDFNKKLFKAIKEADPEKVVLDLRFNSGGNSGILRPFIDNIRKSEWNTSERLYVLVGKKVMSSALLNAVQLKQTTNATFVGQETGGNVNHFGEVNSFHLPNSKITVTYSTKYWETWKGKNGALEPDIFIGYSLFDILKNKDSVLDYVKAK